MGNDDARPPRGAGFAQASTTTSRLAPPPATDRPRNLFGEEHEDDGGPFVDIVPERLPPPLPFIRRRVDYATLTRREREVYDAGFAAGVSHGWQSAEEEAARLHRAAHSVVQRMADLPSHEEITRIRHEGLWGKT